MYNCEAFMDYAYEMFRPGQKWSSFDKMIYQKVRKKQISSSGLSKDLKRQRKICEKKYREAQVDDQKAYEFGQWLEKQKTMMQRKINGTEIKNKQIIKDMIQLYESYQSKLGSLD